MKLLFKFIFTFYSTLCNDKPDHINTVEYHNFHHRTHTRLLITFSRKFVRKKNQKSVSCIYFIPLRMSCRLLIIRVERAEFMATKCGEKSKNERNKINISSAITIKSISSVVFSS